VYCILCSAICYLPGPFHDKAIKWPRCMLRLLVGHVLNLWSAKGDAHETLSLAFQHDGVPPTMVTDDSKEPTKGEFRRKLKEADCHPRVTEPYSPWQQAAEGCIYELKGDPLEKWLRPDHPSVCGTTALSFRHMSALAQAITSIWPLTKCLRPLWLGILPTSVTLLSLAGMTGLCFEITNPLFLMTSLSLVVT
jgi:hypothetical protein